MLAVMNTYEPRTIVVDGARQVYRVAGKGPVCLVLNFVQKGNL